MRFGCDIPHLAATDEVRRYVLGVEELGYHFVGYAGHLACTLDTAFPAPFFTFDEPWREAFTLGAWLAAVTPGIEINPAMVLLPLYPAAIVRAARLADTFKFIAPSFRDLDRVARVTAELREAVAAHGRDPDAFGIEARIIAHISTPQERPALVARCRDLGATHVGFANRIAGGTVNEALATLADFARRTAEFW
jgi:alkanesulfonate monooxygenase SsuD/methylene tetrahydromethanopterin reductase-like flavin-dependent oxidoreductase (luciferase family)